MITETITINLSQFAFLLVVLGLALGIVITKIFEGLWTALGGEE